MVNLNQALHQNLQRQHLDLLQVRDKQFLRVVKTSNPDYGTQSNFLVKITHVKEILIL